eukprot:7471432-Lingulodinium_polyedra.AAC.1
MHKPPGRWGSAKMRGRVLDHDQLGALNKSNLRAAQVRQGARVIGDTAHCLGCTPHARRAT